MMGKPIYGNGFRGCMSYLSTGVDGKNPDRVEWSSSRNLGSLDPQKDQRLAGRTMRATANLSKHCESPVMHVPISWPKEDGKLDRKQMEQVAEKTLKDLKLDKHQAVIYCHNDTDHQHIHIVVNRVNSKTGRAWSTSKDWQRLNKSLTEQEKEMGLTRSDHWGVDKQRDKQRLIDRTRVDDFDEITAATDGERQQAKKEDREPDRLFTKSKVKEVRGQLKEHFADCVSWEELETRLAERGYHLRAKGQGLIVTDGRGYAKLSQMGTSKAKVQAKEMESRFGQSYRDYTASRTQERNEEIKRRGEAVVQHDALEPPDVVGMTDAERRRAMSDYDRKKENQERRQDRQKEDFDKYGSLYADPVEELESADWDVRHWQNVQSQHRELDKGVTSGERDVMHGKKTMDKKESYIEKSRTSFEDYLGKVYRDPEQAARKWDALGREHGFMAAAVMIQEDPASLGKLADGQSRGRASHSTNKRNMKRKSMDLIAATLKRLEESRLKRAKGLTPYLAARRKKWLDAQREMEVLQKKQKKAHTALIQISHDLANFEKSSGKSKDIRASLSKQQTRRNRALGKVTQRMIRVSNLTEERKGQLYKELRLHQEKEREKSRKKDLGLDLGR